MDPKCAGPGAAADLGRGVANEMANDYLSANGSGNKPTPSESDNLPSVKPKEQDRLDVQHAGMLLLRGGKLVVAPLEKEPENVLDVATGTGIWALEYAREHPNSQVIGTDLSAIQPDPAAPNCTFIKDDAEDPWEFGDIRFDYIHLRFVVTCFDNHHGVLSQAFNHLEPGGWIE
ncbi:S-adenosyl-L-methionine-dependent methyltransferase [Apiospora rasikravindrae]|uniref:S-adenosyl-L-methionine-dependent methyltransferase n=1 Tax=Apiospora rasikravindrae TaxID=990691 RepID=A0ABR1U797_9PEZI